MISQSRSSTEVVGIVEWGGRPALECFRRRSPSLFLGVTETRKLRPQRGEWKKTRHDQNDGRRDHWVLLSEAGERESRADGNRRAPEVEPLGSP